MTLPILYHKGKGGALYQWRVWAEGDTVYTEYGQVGGQLQTTVGKRCDGKNHGKKNATTDEEQALLEAKAMHTFKVERKYSLTKDQATEQLFLPMLAHPIEKVKSPTFPAFVQPKLDGVRCLAYREAGKLLLMSRSGKPYVVPHITDALEEILPGEAMFDGELYCHGLLCQQITSLVKKHHPGETEKIQYWVYDMPVISNGADDLDYYTRMQALSFTLEDTREPIVRVTTIQVEDMEDLQALQRSFVQDGFEGLMYRSPEGIYEWGYRSRHLLKVKSFQDAEFTVIGAREGHGKFEGCVVWQCQNDLTDATFDCTPACSMEQRARYYQDRQLYVGRKLTVKFFDRTEDKIPRFPVGKLFRAEEDLG